MLGNPASRMGSVPSHWEAKSPRHSAPRRSHRASAAHFARTLLLACSLSQPRHYLSARDAPARSRPSTWLPRAWEQPYRALILDIPGRHPEHFRSLGDTHIWLSDDRLSGAYQDAPIGLRNPNRRHNNGGHLKFVFCHLGDQATNEPITLSSPKKTPTPHSCQGAASGFFSPVKQCYLRSFAADYPS